MSIAKLRWGIIGPGGIARTFAEALARSETGVLVAIGTRNADKPGLADDFAGADIVQGYDALLAREDLDCVYIATPHSNHVEWAVKSLRAGKHVLVEKPIAMTAAGARRIYEEAQKHRLFAGEAFMYRPHPMTRKVLELLRGGVIGTPRIIRSNFGFDPGRILHGHRLFELDLAGGAILDLGGYPASMVRLLAGATENAPFLDPSTVVGVAHIGGTGVDFWSSALLKFDNGVVGELSCSMQVKQDNTLFVYGSDGIMTVKDFWFATGRTGGTGVIRVIKDDKVTDHDVREDRWLYTFEIEEVAVSIRGNRLEFEAPGMSWNDSIGNMVVLDSWRQSAGMHYPNEQDELSDF
jgi:predicted dehydrogenase